MAASSCWASAASAPPRAQLPDIAAYIPDIREIVVLSREVDGDVVKLHNEWVSDRDVPRVATKFLSPDQLRWDDHATWHSAEHRCEWVIEMRAFRKAVDCRGETRLIDNMALL